ncbi:MAG: hypothetical protein JXB14_01045 [Candidatus Altiarchaeota archaeon]|nr:hypothetical protein [Candidatus Altiarchaeota archaeon]
MDGFVTAQQASLIAGFLLILASSASKKEDYQAAYGVVGLILVFWGLGFFGLGRVVKNMIPALALLFGLFSLYTKGTTQLLTILITIILFYQIFYI